MLIVHLKLAARSFKFFFNCDWCMRDVVVDDECSSGEMADYQLEAVEKSRSYGKVCLD